mmetsp:Transcript_37740/g.89273  ORF Transcript_37740/g.89273 Transcript_37740/m.89273 type:complete len:205 (+) Transcript_37740:350-964(+)
MSPCPLARPHPTISIQIPPPSGTSRRRRASKLAAANLSQSSLALAIPSEPASFGMESSAALTRGSSSPSFFIISIASFIGLVLFRQWFTDAVAISSACSREDARASSASCTMRSLNDWTLRFSSSIVADRRLPALSKQAFSANRSRSNTRSLSNVSWRCFMRIMWLATPSARSLTLTQSSRIFWSYAASRFTISSSALLRIAFT